MHELVLRPVTSCAIGTAGKFVAINLQAHRHTQGQQEYMDTNCVVLMEYFCPQHGKKHGISAGQHSCFLQGAGCQLMRLQLSP